MVAMDHGQVERFIRDGFVKMAGAFPRDTAQACADLLWQQTGMDRDDPATWRQPVYWVGDMAQPPFTEAANSPALRAAFDRLTGNGRWTPRGSLGAFPLRFPHPVEPDNAGWHIDGSYLPEGADPRWHYVNVRSKGRALLMLFLFSEVGERDAPTRIRVGSHLDVPPVLRRYGETGVSMPAIAEEVARASAHRPIAHATGAPGDVYLCHPFLVHAAQPHHGSRPRFMAQPPLCPSGDHELERADGAYSPVELAIRAGLSAGATAASPPEAASR
ncbi:phytanoyl-CoA dioxygenase family protein [Streptomyces ferralitis]|uniref:Phytanoyl-CoA dioxygenase family protein n=2 Tax=Streptantibioticus ferralitis TaxID=236510 RepID=A0ABT5Z300_9ACTN|nr:phytanoyl-CoA dioxygenase family protein [Streptantibioticus ferralitis]MDF2258214.1 phytanoyl-CoA dioxygenase family protein [Streptantibioticus ferralitis]